LGDSGGKGNENLRHGWLFKEAGAGKKPCRCWKIDKCTEGKLAERKRDFKGGDPNYSLKES